MRPEGQCSKYSPAAPIGMTINSPAEHRRPVRRRAGRRSARSSTSTGVTTDVVVGEDAADGPRPAAPRPTAARRSTNAAAIAGKFVYVDRGTCTFQTKADNAEDAGATGIIIGNNVERRAVSARPALTPDIHGLIDRPGQRREDQVGDRPTVNVTIKDVDEATKADSYRWLSGEGDPAFGGAIRDMWNPNCYGDPGKVSDVEYWCSTTTAAASTATPASSTTPTRCWWTAAPTTASTVAGIGLDKAANIFWRTQEAT